MRVDIDAFCIDQRGTILEAVAKMDVDRLGIILVVDEERRLVGTVTDGDVRRAILARVDFKGAISELLARKAGSPVANPITAQVDDDRATLLLLLQQHRILHLPLLDGDRRVVALVTQDEFLPEALLPLQAVVMAGGAGVRLRPLTDGTPKPMLPVGDRPLMEIIIGHLKDAGIRRVSVSTHRHAEQIASHFGDGAQFGVELSYLPEERPLGTAGSLTAMEGSDETLLVMNGDILTHVDFRAMMRFHREHAADLTVAVRQYDLEVPYGVVDCDGAVVTGLTEKPVMKCFVNAGIYLVEPKMCAYIPAGERFDMTDLIQRMLDEGRMVVSFPIREYWLDIGQFPDYEKAQADVKSWKAPKRE